MYFKRILKHLRFDPTLHLIRLYFTIRIGIHIEAIFKFSIGIEQKVDWSVPIMYYIQLIRPFNLRTLIGST